jgi:FAD synthase
MPIVEHPFDKAFSSQSAEDVRHPTSCASRLGVRHVVTGLRFPFRQGPRRQSGLSDAGRCEAWFWRHTGRAVSPTRTADVVSSSRIREALAEGDVAAANGCSAIAMRSPPKYSTVKKLGRTLGYPTANMALPPETALEPRHLCGSLSPRQRHGPRWRGQLRPSSDGAEDAARPCCSKPSCSIFPAISMARPARSPGRH